MKKAYYAKPISIDGTFQAGRDLELILSMGYQPYPVGDAKAKAIEDYRLFGMSAFRSYVFASDALFFRAFPDGSIGFGVAQEIAWAQEIGIPVVEIPRQIERRTLTTEQTQAMLAELGQR